MLDPGVWKVEYAKGERTVVEKASVREYWERGLGLANRHPNKSAFKLCLARARREDGKAAWRWLGHRSLR